jgi:hypothetical protein
VPAIVDVNVASDNDVCALATWVWAEAMAASSEAICEEVALLLWSVESSASSLAKMAWAWANDADSDELSMAARVCPAVTVCPTLTSTAVTRPDAPKLRGAWLAGSIVPDDEAVLVIVPVDTVWTVVVVVINGVALELLVAIHMPKPAATTTVTAAPTAIRFLVSHFRS